jgi:predicted dehydrogenase
LIGFAISGTGAMAARMLATIAASPEARVVRIASGDPIRARDFAIHNRVAAAGSFDEALGDPAVDAVYIAGRNADHARLSLAALAEGKPVLCEKPAACDPDEAEAVVATARAAGCLYMEAVATPFLPAVAEAIAIARARGARRVEASFGYPTRETGLFAPDAGVLLDRAVYPLTLARLILGPVDQTAIDVRRDSAGRDIAARFRLDHSDGGGSDLAVSLVDRLANRLDVMLADGHVAVPAPLLTARRIGVRPSAGPLAQNPFVRRGADMLARLSGRWHPYGASPYAPELAHFCALVRSGAVESPVVTHQLTLEVQWLIAQARAS